MKLQTLFILVAALGLAVVPAQVRAQENTDSPLHQAASWFRENYEESKLDYPGYALDQFAAEDTCCLGAGCGQCGDCRHRMDVWGSVEYLMWWAKGNPLPPLATTSPPGTPQADAGVLGEPDTSILFGDELAGADVQSGGRAILGIWLDRDHNVAASGRFFGLGGDRDNFATDPSLAIVGRPFFNVQLGQPDALLISFPGLTQGTVTATADVGNIISAEASLEIMMHRERCRRVDLIAGYQFFRMDDSVNIDSFSTITELGGILPQGTTFSLSDQFATENEFHGGVIGLKSRMARGCWSLDTLFKAAFGSSRQHVSIVGSGAINIPPGVEVPLNGGFLALPSNIGEYERSRFVIIPEITANLRYHLSQNASVHIGYNIIWISEVVSSGDQIDTALNLSQQSGPLVGPARPAFAFRDQNYWLQGLNFGFSWEF